MSGPSVVLLVGLLLAVLGVFAAEQRRPVAFILFVGAFWCAVGGACWVLAER